MSDARNATNEATQKPATVAVAPSGHSSRAGARTVAEVDALIDAGGRPTDAELESAGYPVSPATVTLPLALLTEALTVLTIYAEVAVPVPSYRGQPLSAHAPRELVERIHRAIGA
jgi:hypothetical protein